MLPSLLGDCLGIGSVAIRLPIDTGVQTHEPERPPFLGQSSIRVPGAVEDLEVFLVRPTGELASEEIDHPSTFVLSGGDERVGFRGAVATEKLHRQVTDVGRLMKPWHERGDQLHVVADPVVLAEEPTVRPGTFLPDSPGRPNRE